MTTGRLKFNPGKMEAFGEAEEYFLYTELKSSQSRSDLDGASGKRNFALCFA